MTTDESAAASYQPTKTLVVREDSSIILAPMLSKALVTVCTRQAKSSKPGSRGCFRLSLRGRLESERVAHSERGRAPAGSEASGCALRGKRRHISSFAYS